MNLLGQQWHVHESENLEHVHDGPEADLSRYDLALGPDSPGARRHELAALNRIEPEYLPGALAVYKKIEGRGDRFRRHAFVRQRIADYLRDVVAPAIHDHATEYRQLAGRLREARHSFTWGANYDLEWLGDDFVQPRLQWDYKAGLAKLCPDDAADDARRIWKKDAPRIWHELEHNGCELHYMVAAPPNWPRTEDLRANIDAGFYHLHDSVMYGQSRDWRESTRPLPWLRGVLVILEDPLSHRGDWNGHYNCFLICDGKPDYAELRRVVGYHINVQPVGKCGRPTLEEFERAGKEAIKYPLQGIPAKSIDKADDRDGPGAPAVTEWTADAFDQWWQAHKGLRRVREWGCLYYTAKRIAEVEAEGYAGELEEPVGATWLGRGRCSAAAFIVEVPLPYHDDAPKNREYLSPCIKITAGEPATGPPMRTRPIWQGAVAPTVRPAAPGPDDW